MPTSIWPRSVIPLLCGMMLLTVSIAVLNTLVPLWLSHDHLATWQAGVVSSAYYTGNLAGTLLAGWLIKRTGFNHSYYIATLIFALATTALGVTQGVYIWSLWRFMAGLGCALIWVIVESALLYSGTLRNRGQLLAVYMIIYYLGTVVGQLLLGKVSTGLFSVLPWVLAVIVAGTLPMVFVKVTTFSEETEELPERLWPMLRLRYSRLALNGCIISGMVLGSLFGLMPVYLAHQGMSDASVGYWMALLVSAGIIGQWPVGRLADRFGRLMVLRIQLFMIILGAIAMCNNVPMMPALFILGCASFTLYPVAMSWACESVRHHQLITMNQALLLSFTTGSLIGLGMTAMLMQNYFDKMLFVVVASVALVYLVMLLRKADRPATPMAHA